MQEKKIIKNSRIKKVSIVGVIPSFAFQRAKYCAVELHRKLPQRFPPPKIVGLLELDWNEKLLEWRQTLGREFWCLRRPVAVFFDDRFIGSDIELIKLTSIGNILMENIPRRDTAYLKEHFRKDYISYLRQTKRIFCYLDICVDEVYVGTLTFRLYSDLLPRTCENFKTLCLGARGPLLSYKGSRIHRIVKGGWLQGGDVQYKTGGGGFSIFCDPLEDECFAVSHDRRGVLSMANAGRHQNGSQFFVTLKPSKWMDGRYVAFGQLVEGSRVLTLLENVETSYECPLKKIEIKSCGKLDLGDVEDVDATYREAPMPAKKPKKIETISEQLLRLIMESLADALAKKDYAPDILDDGDVPSKMNLQLYFQGFYSLPESVLEKSAEYLRNLRRQLLRLLKPSATEIVEVIMYDLLMAVLTRMTTLDDVRETVGHDLYQKMVGGIDMKLELCQKPYVRRLVDQIVTTAESLVNLVTKKITKMKRTSKTLRKFQDRMQEWVQSFVLQETFVGDSYHIAERPVEPVPEPKELPHREGRPCCEIEKKKKEEAERERIKGKYAPDDLCCLGSKIFHVSEPRLSDYFSTCRYGLKRVPKEYEERMPLLELIEISRFKLRWMRRQENRAKGEERLCLEKKVRKWMAEVAYTPETSWLRDVVFEKEDVAVDHVEEIMYGAMTAGLLEMYYFMEEYLKRCGKKKQKLVTRTIYPEDSVSDADLQKQAHPEGDRLSRSSSEEFKGEEPAQEPGEPGESGEPGKPGVPEEPEEPEEPAPKVVDAPPCTCGHPCCVCAFDPHYRAPTPPPSLEGEGEGEGEGGAEGEGEQEELGGGPEGEKQGGGGGEPPVCDSGMELVDLNAVLAEKISLKPDEIDIRSFRWLKPYILEKGCDLKTEFATQAHKWLEGEHFSYKGFLSKHSLVTRASLLSLSISLAELLTEENKMKTEIKNFVYDLWDLYFEEMFKEALLEFPPEEEEDRREGEEGEGEADAEATAKAEGLDPDAECKKIIEKTPPFDFDSYCARMGVELQGKKEERPEPEGTEEETTAEASQRKESEAQEVPQKPEHRPKSKQAAQEHAKPPQEDPKPPEEDAPDGESRHSGGSAREDDDGGAEEEKPKTPVADRREEEPRPDSGVAPAEQPPAGVKKKKSPVVVQEMVDETSSEESRATSPYVLPFWVKFLTELTKQALGALAKVSRLPRRLYFLHDSEVDFDDKMKDWFEFNAFNPQPTKGREIMDYIALHHRSLTNLEDTARSYLKKKKYSELLNRCTRITSADNMAGEIVTDVIDTAMKQTEDPEMWELFVSNLVSSAITSSSCRSEASFEEDENSFQTDERDSRESFAGED